LGEHSRSGGVQAKEGHREINCQRMTSWKSSSFHNSKQLLYWNEVESS